jgi:hypothetical protein
MMEIKSIKRMYEIIPLLRNLKSIQQDECDSTFKESKEYQKDDEIILL